MMNIDRLLMNLKNIQNEKPAQNQIQLCKKYILCRINIEIIERILNGEGNVRSCGIDANKEKINKSLDTLLSKINNLDFEYNF